MTNNRVWMFARDLQALLCRCGENGETSVVSLSKDHSPSQVRVMYMYTYFLTELGRVGRGNIWLEVLTYGPSATRFDLHGWEKNIFLSDQTQSIGILSCDRFEKFCVNLIKTRWTGARGTTTKKILQKMTFPLFFSSQNKKITIHQKTFFFLLFSFFLGVFPKKPCSYRAGQLFMDRLSSTRAALRMSAFSMVFHGTTRTVPHGSFDKCAGWWHNHLFLSPKKNFNWSLGYYFFAVWGKDEDSKGWRNCQVESKNWPPY